MNASGDVLTCPCLTDTARSAQLPGPLLLLLLLLIA
jgi:hypothetical protein